MLLAAVSMPACTSGDARAREEGVPTSDTIVGSAFAVPPTTGALTTAAPASLRSFPFPEELRGRIHPLSATEVLVEGEVFAVVDLVSESWETIDPPPVAGELQANAFTVADGAGFSLTQECQPEDKGCDQPLMMAVWGLDIAQRRWRELVRFDPLELLGREWERFYMTVMSGTWRAGWFSVAVEDDSGTLQPARIEYNPTTGAVRTGPLESGPASRMDTFCRLGTGANARLDPDQRWAFQVRPSPIDDWQTVEGDRPSVLLACGRTRAWALTADHWTSADADGTVRSNVSVAEIHEPDVINRSQTVLGRRTDAVTLVMVLNRDLDGDEHGGDRYDLVILPADGPPLTREYTVGREAAPPDIQRATALPGGGVVMFTGGGSEPMEMLVAE
jgi:hypothetical protein